MRKESWEEMLLELSVAGKVSIFVPDGTRRDASQQKLSNKFAAFVFDFRYLCVRQHAI